MITLVNTAITVRVPCLLYVKSIFGLSGNAYDLSVKIISQDDIRIIDSVNSYGLIFLGDFGLNLTAIKIALKFLIFGSSSYFLEITTLADFLSLLVQISPTTVCVFKSLSLYSLLFLFIYTFFYSLVIYFYKDKAKVHQLSNIAVIALECVLRLKIILSVFAV
ncbi:uncharacterized protein EV154DRAFT_488701 [Mucor mucedo]|uniref:uncharacterized protein n=1 Tax=Mucor mucedo TaxID=29922 RepID=UPI00221E3DA7|nr:uncharacterized protein EV154DRAFT_488701 [Mucor mucedo]KAI7865459.1 hypothetical protein EV154DRAFT_488701 [Mucor mucedo]